MKTYKIYYLFTKSNTLFSKIIAFIAKFSVFDDNNYPTHHCFLVYRNGLNKIYEVDYDLIKYNIDDKDLNNYKIYEYKYLIELGNITEEGLEFLEHKYKNKKRILFSKPYYVLKNYSIRKAIASVKFNFILLNLILDILRALGDCIMEIIYSFLRLNNKKITYQCDDCTKTTFEDTKYMLINNYLTITNTKVYRFIIANYHNLNEITPQESYHYLNSK